MASIDAVASEMMSLLNSHNEALVALTVERDLKKNAIFAERTKVLAENNATAKFWAAAIASHPDLRQELMGSYDDAIFASLTNFNVTYLEDGRQRMEMAFAQNEFFTDKTLWIELSDEAMETSGIQWKEGKGPRLEDDEDVKESPEGKRDRDEDDDGRSLFEVFADMPPSPENLDEEEEEEDEEYAEEFEAVLSERTEIFRCLVDEVWARPAGSE